MKENTLMDKDFTNLFGKIPKLFTVSFLRPQAIACNGCRVGFVAVVEKYKTCFDVSRTNEQQTK